MPFASLFRAIFILFSFFDSLLMPDTAGIDATLIAAAYAVADIDISG
jgi:hypothetical protein